MVAVVGVDWPTNQQLGGFITFAVVSSDLSIGCGQLHCIAAVAYSFEYAPASTVRVLAAARLYHFLVRTDTHSLIVQYYELEAVRRAAVFVR